MRDLSVVHRNARHLQSLVNDVLDLARIEAAQMVLLLEHTDPAALVEEAVGTARGLVESRGLALRTEIEPGLPTLRVDPVRIRQVLFNLLNNAARFTETGSVAVSAGREGREVVFSVSDTGVGIDSEDIPKVFHDFEQLDDGIRRRNGGAGLGLAISRDFVELHGGRIWAESELGKGSTFSFGLPLQQPGTDATRFVRAGQADRPAARRTGDQGVLLAVTRSQSAAGLLTRYVKGVRTVVASDLDQAREIAHQMLPQAVVIDTASVSMDGDGPTALAGEWDLPTVPFVACPLPGEETLRQDLAVAGYLIKPVSRTALWDTLRPLGEQIDRVLVVDDDRDFVRLLSRLLDSPVRRYEVGTAHTGAEAIEMIRRWEPDLVLLDLGLPDMDGAQVVDRVQGDASWRHTPIVIVSGQDEIGNLEAVSGGMSVGKVNGLLPAEVIQWIQSIVDTVMQKPSLRESESRV